MTTTPTPESVEALAMAIYCHSPDDEMPVGLIREMAAKACIERLHSLGFTITRAEPAPLPDGIEDEVCSAEKILDDEFGPKDNWPFSFDKTRAHIAALTKEIEATKQTAAGHYLTWQRTEAGLREQIAALEAENKRLREVGSEVLRYDGGKGSECYNAIRLYDAREKLKEALAQPEPQKCCRCGGSGMFDYARGRDVCLGCHGTGKAGA